MTDQSKALQQDAEVQRIAKRGARAARMVEARVKSIALNALRTRKVHGVKQVILTSLQETMRDSMIASHLAALQSSRGLELSVFTSVIGFLTKKLGVNLKQLQEKYDTKAFQILSDVSDGIETKLQETVSNLIQSGAHKTEGVKELRKQFDNLGVSAKNDFQLETIFRTQSQLAYGAGRWEADQDPDIQEILWGYTYVTVGDDRVRPEHAALDGTTLPKEDPFWQRFFPPNGWNCRCQAIAVFEEREVVRPTKSVEPDPDFNFNPGLALAHPRSSGGRWIRLCKKGSYKGRRVRVLGLNKQGIARVVNPDGTYSFVRPHFILPSDGSTKAHRTRRRKRVNT